MSIDVNLIPGTSAEPINTGSKESELTKVQGTMGLEEITPVNEDFSEMIPREGSVRDETEITDRSEASGLTHGHRWLEAFLVQ